MFGMGDVACFPWLVVWAPAQNLKGPAAVPNRQLSHSKQKPNRLCRVGTKQNPQAKTHSNSKLSLCFCLLATQKNSRKVASASEAQSPGFLPSFWHPTNCAAGLPSEWQQQGVYVVLITEALGTRNAPDGCFGVFYLNVRTSFLPTNGFSIKPLKVS